MGDGRDVFHEPAERALIRTADVYQTNLDEGVAGYSDTLLSIVANFTNSGKPEGYNAESMVGKSKRGEVALVRRCWRARRWRRAAFFARWVQDARVPCHDRLCKRHLHDDRGQDLHRGACDHARRREGGR